MTCRHILNKQEEEYIEMTHNVHEMAILIRNGVYGTQALKRAEELFKLYNIKGKFT